MNKCRADKTFQKCVYVGQKLYDDKTHFFGSFQHGLIKIDDEIFMNVQHDIEQIMQLLRHAQIPQ